MRRTIEILLATVAISTQAVAVDYQFETVAQGLDEVHARGIATVVAEDA